MEVVEEVEEKVTKKIVKRYCDGCGKELYWSLGCQHRECRICGKLLCHDCIGYEEDTGGDYHYMVYCKPCTDLYRSQYKSKVDELNRQRYGLLNDYEKKGKSLWESNKTNQVKK